MRNLDLTTPDDASGDTPDASLITPLPDLVRGVASGKTTMAHCACSRVQHNRRVGRMKCHYYDHYQMHISNQHTQTCNELRANAWFANRSI